MSTAFSLTVTTAQLAVAMSAIGGEDFATIAAWNAGVYAGTLIPLRKLTGSEIVTVTGSASGARVTDTDGGWISDRFGTLGARQVRALLALI